MLAGYLSVAPASEQLALVDILAINSQGDNEDITMAVNPGLRPDFAKMTGQGLRAGLANHI